MFTWIRNLFAASHVDVAVRDLENAKAKLEAAVLKETTHLTKIGTTIETAIAKTTDIQRVIEDDFKRLVAAEVARFESVKSKLDSKKAIKDEAVAKGEELLNKIKAVI